tara:strand:+ start:846 stop:1286 length:441 start_codon:yes stop_codon:yes gene_type:complete
MKLKEDDIRVVLDLMVDKEFLKKSGDIIENYVTTKNLWDEEIDQILKLCEHIISDLKVILERKDANWNDICRKYLVAINNLEKLADGLGMLSEFVLVKEIKKHVNSMRSHLRKHHPGPWIQSKCVKETFNKISNWKERINYKLVNL